MIDKDKTEVRKYIREKKKRFTLDEKKYKSISIFEQIEKLEVFENANTIMLYWSMDDEVFTHDFILKWHNQKTIILPSVKGDELELRKFEGVDKMVPGQSFGIGEPIGEIINNPKDIALIIVPGVAFDRQNNRLGRGKAYYDKLLRTTKAIKIGVCFDFQLLDSVPTDEHDIKMDIVISEIIE